MIGVDVSGWIPVCSCREALQQVLFAAGAMASCARSGLVQISPSKIASELVSFTHTITAAQKSLQQSLELKPLVTGAEVTSHKYVADNVTRSLLSDTLAVGTYKIVFSEPAHTLTITGASIVSSGANHAIISVASPGAVTLTGKGYADTKRVTGVYNLTLDVGVPTNIMKIDNATMVSPSAVQVVTQRVYDYYAQRYVQHMKMFQHLSGPGDSATVSVMYANQLGGVIEKMEIDLAGGFVSKVDVVGVIL